MKQLTVADQIISEMEKTSSNKLSFTIKNLDKVNNDCFNYPTYKIFIKVPYKDDQQIMNSSDIMKSITKMNTASLNYILSHDIDHIRKEIYIHAIPIVESA